MVTGDGQQTICPLLVNIDQQTETTRSKNISVIEFDFIECFTTTFLRAHSWLNWVDEDDDEDEVGFKEKPEDTRYIKIEISPLAPGVWTKDLINFIPIYCHHWDCRLGPVQVRQAWGYLWGGEMS